MIWEMRDEKYERREMGDDVSGSRNKRNGDREGKGGIGSWRGR
jgi:hypothetical protein